jgi:hypothetical protein
MPVPSLTKRSRRSHAARGEIIAGTNSANVEAAVLRPATPSKLGQISQLPDPGPVKGPGHDELVVPWGIETAPARSPGRPPAPRCGHVQGVVPRPAGRGSVPTCRLGTPAQLARPGLRVLCVAAQSEPDVYRGVLGVLVAQSHLVGAERCAAAGAVGGDSVALVDQAPVPKLLDDPPAGLDVAGVRT